MKKKIAVLLAASLIFGSVPAFALTKADQEALKPAPPATKTEEAVITITESEVIQQATRNNMGLCWEHQEFSDENILGGKGSIELSDEYKEIAKQFEGCFSVARTMGAPSSWFHPMNNIGPLEERFASKNELHESIKDVKDRGGEPVVATELQDGEKRAFGPTEWIKAAREINQETSFIVCLNLVTATPEESRKYALFLTSPKGTVVDGTDWGALREEYGLGSEPVNVAMYELGNEHNWWSMTPEQYCGLAIPHMEAVRAVDPNAKFAYCGSCVLNWDEGIEGMGWRSWTLGVAAEIGNFVDYCTWHYYHDGCTLALEERYLDQLQKDHIEACGREIPVVITEHADWPTDTSAGFTKDPISLIGALTNIDWLNRRYQRPDVWGGTYFLSTEYPTGCWGTFLKIDEKLTLTGSAYAYIFYNKGIGERVVKREVTGAEFADETRDDCQFTAAVFTSGKRDMSVIMMNKSEDTNLHLNFVTENGYTLVEEITLAAPNLYSYVTSQETKDIFSITSVEKNEPNFTEYTMPAKSAVILKLKSDTDYAVTNVGGTEGADVVAVPDETSFSDLDGIWSRGEIESLAANEILDGDGSGNFRPQDSITRAELAKMLVAATGVSIEDVNYNVFRDVNLTDWFAPYINAAYAKGYLRGYNGEFSPNSTVTMEELAVIAARFADNSAITAAEKENLQKTFLYWNEASGWAQEGILQAAKSGMINKLYENGGFRPKQDITRAQAAVIVYRIWNTAKEGA